jgi:hypothetical protein
MNATLASWLDNVPEESKPFISALKKDVDAALVKLADRPTEQVPAAGEASWMLQRMAEAFTYLQDLNARFISQMEAMTKQFGLKVERVNELEGKLSKKELLAREDAEAEAKSAVDKALADERARVKLMGDRRAALCEANLPVAPDEVLAGDESFFKALRTESEARHKQLKEMGVVSRLNGAELADLCYGPRKDYDRYVKLAEALRGDAPEPLAGGGKREETGKLTF